MIIGIRYGVIATLIFSSFAAFTAESPSQDTVIVSRGTAKVTFADVDAYVQRIPAKDRAGFMDSPKRIENLLDGLLLQQQLANAARNAKLDQTPAFQQQMKLSETEVLSKQALAAFEANLKTPDLTVLAKETYATHKTDYLIHAQVDVKHILVDTKSRSDEEAKALATTIETQAKADPAAFDSLILKYSDDPSKGKNLGLMSDATAAKYDKAFSAGAAALKNEGDVSAPIHSSFGYHILKLVKRTAEHQRSYEDVRDQLLAQLTAQYREQQIRAYSSGFTDQPLDAKPDLVESLRDRYMPAGTNGVLLPSEPAPAVAPPKAH